MPWAGRIFAQGAKLVNNAFDSGAMWNSPVWKRAIQANTSLLGIAIWTGRTQSYQALDANDFTSQCRRGSKRASACTNRR